LLKTTQSLAEYFQITETSANRSPRETLRGIGENNGAVAGDGAAQ
jgi:hypothetical protein